jgi:hypothetical protein
VGVELVSQQMQERRPRGRAGDLADPDLVQRGVLDAALGPAVGGPRRVGARVNAGAGTWACRALGR